MLEARKKILLEQNKFKIICLNQDLHHFILKMVFVSRKKKLIKKYIF